METNMPTSFIPKKPVSNDPVSSHTSTRAVGLLSIMATISVLATIVSFVFVFFYQKQLVSQKSKIEISIDDAKNNIGTDFIKDMKLLDSRIGSIKSILENHIAVSTIFSTLEKSTLRSIQYKNFSYTLNSDPGSKNKTVQVSLTGSAKSYATIALQSDAFTKNSFIKNPIFSGLSINEKTNIVEFKLVFSVDPNDISYQKLVDVKSKIDNLSKDINTTQ